MKNITLLKLEKYKNPFCYEKIEEGIYKDLNDLDSKYWVKEYITKFHQKKMDNILYH